MENVTLDVTGTKTLFSPIRLVVEKVDRFPARFPIGGMTWDVTVVDPAERPIVDYQDQTENGFGLFDISGTVTVKKSAEDSGEVITIDEKWLAEQFPGVRAPEETADE